MKKAHIGIREYGRHDKEREGRREGRKESRKERPIGLRRRIISVGGSQLL